MAGSPVKVGIIGTGNIAPRYVTWGRTFDILDIVACADLDSRRAEAFAAEHGLRALSVAAMLAEAEIEIIINLTPPMAHTATTQQILHAGKHVYSEKPLGIDRDEAANVLALAGDKGLLVGCAPDTFLGGGLQTCRKLIDDGVIGRPIGAAAFLTSRGMESWHPNPFFFYERGGGPMFDMGPYYLTALVALLGPIDQVAAMTRISFPTRTATTPALMGREIPVSVPTHYSGSLAFDSGAIATLIMSFDVWQATLPRIEIYGEKGTLSVPDPNTHRGPVRVWTPETEAWEEVPLTHSAEVERGIGVADLAYALRSGRPARASGALAYHVLDAMSAFEESSTSGQAVTLRSTIDRPAPLPLGLPAGQLDA